MKLFTIFGRTFSVLATTLTFLGASEALGAPMGWFDGINSSSATVSSTINGNGWAADADLSAGAPVQRVDIRVDGNSTFDAQLGDARQDVVNAFNRPDFIYSGWHFSYAASNLSAGTHTLSAWAYTSNGWTQLGNTWNVTVAANQAPSCAIDVDGHSPGDSVTRPYGGSVSVTVHFRASDPDNNLYGIRFNIWNSTTNYFNSGGGGFTNVGSTSGEVVQTVTLDTNGDWYFWTDAQDTMGAYASTGDWGRGFHLVVTEGAPPTARRRSSDSRSRMETSTKASRILSMEMRQMPMGILSKSPSG
jgi:hypothetical protein